MNIKSVKVREIAMARRFSFHSSRGQVSERRIIIVTVCDNDGCQGWGECTAPEEPRYCEEWTESAWHTINTLLAPFLVSRMETNFEELKRHFDKFRGNRMAKAAIEVACWDLEARRQCLPLWQLIGGDNRPIPCGVSLGIADSVDELLGNIEKEVESGYQRIKLKIQPGWDINVVESVRAQFPTLTLTVDANGAYRLSDINILKQLDTYGLLMIEQPFAPDDLWAYRQSRGQITTPICLDETVISALGTKAFLNLGLCDIINVKLGRVGGHSESKEIVNQCLQHHIPCWCGGQHEAGLGRAHNIALAALMPRSMPSELSASSRYWAKDIIIPEIAVDSRGYIKPPLAPGCGFEMNESFIDHATTRTLIHRR